MKIKVSPNILLVEDDGDLAEMYQLQLEGLGFNVHVASHAQEAIDKLESQPANIIVLDVLLAEQNGLSVLHELRSYNDWRQIPVVILSNVSAQELGINKAMLERLGVFAYLEKAKTKPDTLKSTINAALATAD